jgi:hypothetical protein
MPSVQLIKKRGDKLELCDDGVKHLKSLDKEFGTCVCIGPYRQGKSYLLNLLTDNLEAFKLGHTDRACTKGVWMYKKPVEVKTTDGRRMKVLFFDTEVKFKNFY